MFSPRAAGVNELRIRKFPLRILIEHFQVSMCGGGVQIVIQLFAIFAVVAFAICEAKETFLEDWVALIPKHEREAKPLMVVAKSCDAVLAPSISSAASMVVGKGCP